MVVILLMPVALGYQTYNGMAVNTQAESVIKNIIKEICLECSSQGENVSETLAAFMVSTDLCMKSHELPHYTGSSLPQKDMLSSNIYRLKLSLCCVQRLCV